MAIIYQKNKKTGVTYAYESKSIWVPELKQPRSKRVYLGRVAEDGTIIPSSKHPGRKPKQTELEKPVLPESVTPAASSDLSQETADLIAQKDQEIASLKKQLNEALSKLDQIRDVLSL